MHYYLFTFVLALIPTFALAQTIQFEDVPNRSGIQTGYNRFSDETIVASKRDVVSGVIGKKSLLDPSANSRAMEIFAAAFFKGRQPRDTIKEVIFAILPEATTKGGRFTQRLEHGPLYISPDSPIVVIADEDRFELGRVTKTTELNVFGNYSGAAFISIPIESFRKITIAKKLEMAVGSIEIKFSKRHQERLQNLLAEIESLQPKTSKAPSAASSEPNSAQPQTASPSQLKPTPMPENKKTICFENGRKVPCP